MLQNISDEKFESDSDLKYKQIKNSFLLTVDKIRWDKDKGEKKVIAYFFDEIAQIPNDPFSKSLIQLLEWEYGTLAKPISGILNRILEIRPNFRASERQIIFKKECYSFWPLTKNQHPRKVSTFDAEGKLCSVHNFKLHIKYRYFFKIIHARSKKERIHYEKKFLGLTRSEKKIRELRTCVYSPILNIRCKDLSKYYEFFVDYYAKKRFRQYVQERASNANQNRMPERNKIENIEYDNNINKKIAFAEFTKAQQVLFFYYFLKLLGIESVVDTNVTYTARFLHAINGSAISKICNSEFYRFALKAPYLKGDKRLLKDLEFIRDIFSSVDLPFFEIEKLIFDIKNNLEATDQ